ncbi:VOC family protein [Paenibacillus sp. OV219]|uniref:VOC family protein n=1 Tax=Paenibacillus sp. OV219 TaxID=1884377 RepID=UPI0008D89C0A|nr:VOC family protein [Paenibacillus sp. OV219]SEN53507.1 Glyoxalase superfamily enzyme, possibly 3-demethylubiquinone-9 3-methyltransferase [Paenibacillus sp. OV219]
MEAKQPKITPFLMFEGRAEEAMNYYISVFDKSEIVSMLKYEAGGPGPEGNVMNASFKLGDQMFMCSDSFVKHAFTFTPSISHFVTCETEAEIERAYEMLSKSGSVLMPLGEYPFSRKFGWVQDQFGVSWQLSLA